MTMGGLRVERKLTAKPKAEALCFIKETARERERERERFLLLLQY